jgi:hypothetical protein
LPEHSPGISFDTHSPPAHTASNWHCSQGQPSCAQAPADTALPASVLSQPAPPATLPGHRAWAEQAPWLNTQSSTGQPHPDNCLQICYTQAFHQVTM